MAYLIILITWHLNLNISFLMLFSKPSKSFREYTVVRIPHDHDIWILNLSNQ